MFSFAVTNFNDHYNYKAYLKTLLSYDHNVKKTNLKLAGWEDDSAGLFDSKANPGWKSRQTYFIQSRTTTGTETLKFKKDGTTFLAPLITDFNECSQGLIPYVPWSVELDFEKPNFVIWSAEDNINYKLEILKVCLHVPCGVLNKEICMNIDHALSRSPARYFYRGKQQNAGIFWCRIFIYYFSFRNVLQTDHYP
jgi:hypothetical protein